MCLSYLGDDIISFFECLRKENMKQQKSLDTELLEGKGKREGILCSQCLGL